MIGGGYSDCKFRSRKDTTQNLYVPLASLSAKGIYPRFLGHMKSSEVLASETECRLVLENGRYFVIVGIALDTTGESQADIVAIDPGVRSFITFYSPDSCGKIGLQDFSIIQRLCSHLDKLISKRALSRKNKQRQRMNKAIKRLKWRIRDLIDELHHKTALFLCKNFSVILLPTFEISQMAIKSNRKIQSNTVRNMLTFAHFRFKQFLKHKAREFGTMVVDVTEEYTSKTCSWNGNIVSIGSKKYIEYDGIVVDRDYNAARGIFLKALRDTSIFNF